MMWFKIEFIFVYHKEEVSVEVLKTYIQVSFQKRSLFSLMEFRCRGGGRKADVSLQDEKSYDAANALFSRVTWKLA